MKKSAFCGLLSVAWLVAGCVTSERREAVEVVDAVDVPEGDGAVEPGGPDGGACVDETVCDNGTGPAVGACQDGFLVPSDRCRAGVCEDARLQAPVTGYALDGTWQLSLMSFGGGNGGPGTVSTLRARLEVGSDGVVRFDDVAASDAAWISTVFGAGSGQGRTASVCVGENGEIRLVFSGLSLVGYLDDSGGVFVVAGPGGLGLAVRPESTEGVEDARYHMLYVTERLAPREAATYVTTGEMKFRDGCLTEKVSVVDDEGTSYALEPDPGGCMAAQGNEVVMSFSFATTGVTEVRVPLKLRGVVSSGGALIAGLSDSPILPGTPAGGWFVLVRSTGEKVDMAGDWGLVSAAFEGAPRFEEGTVTLSESAATGELRAYETAAEPAWSSWEGWAVTGDKQEVSYRLSLDDGATRHASGWLADTGRFGLLMHVMSVAPTSEPSVLRATPVGPGVVLMVGRGRSAVLSP